MNILNEKNLFSALKFLVIGPNKGNSMNNFDSFTVCSF